MTFRRLPALGHRDFRNFWTAQSISLVGTWMQTLSLPWVAYTLSPSPFYLGLASAVQYFPLLLLSLPAGAVADQADRRKLVLLSQGGLAILSALMALLLLAGWMTYPLLLVLGFALGTFQALDFPGRQSLLPRIVHREHVANAVALNSSAFNAARMVGPAAAGLVLAAWGPAWCFALNALSYVPVLLILVSMGSRREFRGEGVELGKVVLAVPLALKYVAQEPKLLGILGATSLMGIFAVNHTVILPVKISQSMGGSSSTFAFLISAMGIGSFLSAILLALRGKKPPLSGLMPWFALGAAAAMAVLAFVHTLPGTLAAMVVLGLGNVAFFTTANSSLQHHSTPEFRGRVMSMYALAFGGLTPLGSLLVGLLMEYFPAETAFLFCAGAVALGMGGLMIVNREKNLVIEPGD